MSTDSYTIRQLEDLTTEQLHDLAERIAACYVDDPVTRIEFENREVEIIYRYGTLLSLSMGSGEIHVAEAGTGEIVGIAMIAPPGRTIYDRPEQVELGWKPFLKACSKEYRKWWEGFLSQLEKWSAAQMSAEEKKKLWTLGQICVLPAYQRKGIGTILFQVVVNKAAAGGTGFFLYAQTEYNQGWYEHFGLRVRGQKKVFAGPKDGEFVPVVCMST